jgi:hypothetical protein
MKPAPAFVAHCDLEECIDTILSLRISRLPHIALYLTHMTTYGSFRKIFSGYKHFWEKKTWFEVCQYKAGSDLRNDTQLRSPDGTNCVIFVSYWVVGDDHRRRPSVANMVREHT